MDNTIITSSVEHHCDHCAGTFETIQDFYYHLETAATKQQQLISKILTDSKVNEAQIRLAKRNSVLEDFRKNYNHALCTINKLFNKQSEDLGKCIKYEKTAMTVKNDLERVQTQMLNVKQKAFYTFFNKKDEMKLEGDNNAEEILKQFHRIINLLTEEIKNSTNFLLKTDIPILPEKFKVEMEDVANHLMKSVEKIKNKNTSEISEDEKNNVGQLLVNRRRIIFDDVEVNKMKWKYICMFNKGIITGTSTKVFCWKISEGKKRKYLFDSDWIKTCYSDIHDMTIYQNLLFICECDNKQPGIYIHELNGNLVRKMANKIGAQFGEYYMAASIAPFLTSDVLLVADKYNNRVQWLNYTNGQSVKCVDMSPTNCSPKSIRRLSYPTNDKSIHYLIIDDANRTYRFSRNTKSNTNKEEKEKEEKAENSWVIQEMRFAQPERTKIVAFEATKSHLIFATQKRIFIYGRSMPIQVIQSIGCGFQVGTIGVFENFLLVANQTEGGLLVYQWNEKLKKYKKTP
ncbi:hypothetical protein SNEBB_001177 [Seison nebaliae]|nr:hypothetical protein SNEBB_001177 [Seison nebaliae]